MRTGISILSLLILSAVAISSAPAQARPRGPAAGSDAAQNQAIKASHRSEARHRRHHVGHGKHYRTHHDGWLPALKEYRHLPGQWNHDRCHDWHRCHYYFYGYEQWVRWNPDKSRAYFRRHYHH